MRCLANALLLKEPPRQIFVDLGAAPKAAEMLKVWWSFGDLRVTANKSIRLPIQMTNFSFHEYFFS